MSTGTTIYAEAQGLYKIFNPGQPSKAEYDGERLHITGGNIRSLRNDEIESVKLDLRLLHHAIVLTLKNGTNIELSGFKEHAAPVLLRLFRRVGCADARLSKVAGRSRDSAHTMARIKRRLDPGLSSLQGKRVSAHTNRGYEGERGADNHAGQWCASAPVSDASSGSSREMMSTTRGLRRCHL